MINQSMGDLIAALRKEQGMTQKDLAEKMSVTDKAVSKWERNLSCPDVNAIPRLAEALGVSVEELLNAAPKQEPEQSEQKSGEVQRIVELVLKAVPVAMGAAVVVLGVMDQIDSREALTALGIGVFCLGLGQLRKKESQ